MPLKTILSFNTLFTRLSLFFLAHTRTNTHRCIQRLFESIELDSCEGRHRTGRKELMHPCMQTQIQARKHRSIDWISHGEGGKKELQRKTNATPHASACVCVLPGRAPEAQN
mmetsp:Transcript_31217/g.61610  ORF Transcript_31217/g.61610 Transcript_31217/m.61610 type:complete len:112 (+) Transcript_31217:952-1287(+)